jgi:hypothetical protein
VALIIVNGPIAKEVSINAGYNAFGQASAPTSRSAAPCGSC